MVGVGVVAATAAAATVVAINVSGDENDDAATAAAAPGTTTAGAAPGGGSGAGRGGITLSVNGQSHQVDAAPDTPLLYVLRDEIGLTGPKFGCGLSQCGACAVLQDGRQIRSCVTPVSAAASREITTLEGLAASYRGAGADPSDPDAKHPLQQAWIDEQVPQCGYCQNGMLIQAADLLATTPEPSEEEIVRAMDGHLCRCGTYNGIVRAIQRASREMAA
jgi:aerobic-type carbon monoxide dehydrogenase small subunit (CoxS/CutS family)